MPCPVASYGVACCPYGSNQLLDPPRQLAARSGSVGSTPLSRVATTTPWPVSPAAQTAGLPMVTWLAVGSAAGVTTRASGRTDATSARAAMRARRRGTR